MDELHQPTSGHQDVSVYLTQLDNLDYDAVLSVLDRVKVEMFGDIANIRPLLVHLLLPPHYKERLNERRKSPTERF